MQHRLYLLLKLMGHKGVAEYSSTISQKKRSIIFSKFKKGDIKVYALDLLLFAFLFLLLFTGLSLRMRCQEG